MKAPFAFRTTLPISDGEEHYTRDSEWMRIVCCDCSLTHDVRIQKSADEKGFIVRMWRRPRSTAAYRRALSKKLREALRRA